MKTNLPASILTVQEAKEFLTVLFDNGESYHPEDDAADVGNWSMTIFLPIFTEPEAEQLNKLMEDIYNLEGNNGNHANPIFDPCGFLLDLAEERIKPYIYKGATIYRSSNGNAITVTEIHENIIVLKMGDSTFSEEMEDIVTHFKTGYYTPEPPAAEQE